jgi:Protein of unknown function (DUF616)
MERVAVYTAIYGGYDALLEQPEMPGVDFVCFTDDPELRSSQWRVIHAKPRYEHPRMSAKWFKMHPHEVLPKHRRTVWVDGNVQMLGADFAAVILAAISSDGLSLFRHPVRDSATAEAEFCVPLKKCAGLPLVEQVAHYRAQGFPDESGLWYGGIIGRENARKIRRLGRLWMRENLRWTYRDQLSLPYLLWRLGIEPGRVPVELHDGTLTSRVRHTRTLVTR